MTKFNPAQRRKARYFAVQALYQWQMSHAPVLELEQQFAAQPDIHKADLAYFKRLIYAIPSQVELLDDLLTPVMSRTLTEVNPVERAILRLATYELKECLETPYRVIINEALELAKIFSPEEAYKFINGTLDKLARELRPLETKK